MYTGSSFSSVTPECVRAFQERFPGAVCFNECLAPYLAYRVGGPADILVFPRQEEDLAWISTAAKRFSLPVTIIGTGTNLLVVDRGVRGITVSLLHAFQEITRLESSPSAGTTLIRCGGGVSKPSLLEWALNSGLSGLEFSAGVPGTIGGGIFMNAGTKYGCYGDILREMTLFDFASGFRQIRREETHFGYREQSAVGKSLVTSVIFELSPGNSSAMRQETQRIIREREEKQPLDYPSCGSTFKNPEGHSAGRLIERAGLKGASVGGAEVSTKHANFILNKNNAKAKDILDLIEVVKKRVKDHSGVELECEVIVLGEQHEGQIPNPP